MPLVSRVIVVCSEARLAESVRFGFERAGAAVSMLDDAAAVTGCLDAHPELIVAGAGTSDAARALLGGLREALAAGGHAVPILGIGPPALSRQSALEAGASEHLPQPAFVRDAITLGQLLAARARAESPRSIEGHLSDYGGVFYLARAMAAVERSATLCLVRGLRRGELRFYHGEITSAQVGPLHGMAALHQLLLWTRAHFELRFEEVVPRRQIPLSAGEILADAERFLHEMRAVVGVLVPAEVYELVPEQVEGYSASIPAAVYRIVQLIDGYRTMADVIEDSPYRVHETLRLANRLADLGWIRPAARRDTRNRSVEQVLADELAEDSAGSIGTVELEPIPAEDAVPEPVDEDEDETPGPFDTTMPMPRLEPNGDWSDVLPVEMTTGFSPVVPASEAAGELVSRSDTAGDGGAPGPGGNPAPDRDRGDGPAGDPGQRVSARASRIAGSAPSGARDHPGAGADVELARPPHPSSSGSREVPASLWKRLFRRDQDRAEAERRRAGGKRGRKSRSRHE